MTRAVGLGVGLTVLVGVVAGVAWGGRAVVGAVGFGLLATAVQAAGIAFVRPALGAPLAMFMKRWGVGMAFRLTGVIAFAVAVALRPDVFQPLPSAVGYVGVIVPLLFVETRYLR
ncbi:MAG TPA: hypothetical protein VF970_10880 [Gemmatimonadales bacterium]